MSGKKTDQISVVEQMFHMHATTDRQRKKKKVEQTYLPVKDTSILVSPFASHQCSQHREVLRARLFHFFFLIVFLLKSGSSITWQTV